MLVYVLYMTSRNTFKLYLLVSVLLLIFLACVFSLKREITIYFPTESETCMEIETIDIIPGTVSAYSSSEDETDDTPNITASGHLTTNGIVANNCLPFGAIVEIDNTLYQVQDRMNDRYGCERFDIWVESKHSAYQWGVQNHQIKVLKK